MKLVRVNAKIGDKEDFLGEAEMMLSLTSPSLLKVGISRLSCICALFFLTHSSSIKTVSSDSCHKCGVTDCVIRIVFGLFVVPSSGTSDLRTYWLCLAMGMVFTRCRRCMASVLLNVRVLLITYFRCMAYVCRASHGCWLRSL